MNEPTLGSLIVRECLVERILSAPEGIVGIVAPAGYGKSVVALQTADAPVFDAVIWIDCSWVSDSTAQLSSAVCAALDGRVPGPVLRPGDSILPEARVETWVDATERLREYSGKVLCFVLDSLNAPFGTRDLLSLNLVLRRVAARGSKLIVTARMWPTDDCGSTAAYLVTAPELRLTLDEAFQLQDVLETSIQTKTIAAAHAACQGQAALMVVLLRHIERSGASGSQLGSTDGQMSHMLASMIRTQLDSRAIRMLCLCALMQRGFVRDLMDFDPEAVATARHIGHVLPLFRLEGNGSSSAFAVHDILSSFVVENLGEWESLDLGAVIEHALSVLDAAGQIERIFILLELVGSPSLISNWLLKRGRDLLAVGGLMALGRAFDSVSVADTIREPKLLLLQARMMREQAEYESALKKARVAGELARCDCDQATAHDAMMLQVRLLMDLGRLEDAVDGIRSAFLLGVPRGSSSAIVLMHCFMASCLGLTGHLEEARLHYCEAVGLMDEHTCDEVRARVLITATVLDGLIEGRWDLAARHGRQALALKEVAPSCQFQVLGNHSHALLELGDLERSEHAAREVVAKSGACGLEDVELVYEFNIAACRAANGDYDGARRLADEAIASVEALGETHTACMCQAMWVTCHVAAGDHEGAVCRAEHALELAMDLQAHHLRADAQIQLAAALLAVNDVAAAAGLASQALGQATADGSRNLMLAGDLIASECARRMDVPDCERSWSAHAKYVATGSMNWRLAMLVRAFPEMMISLVRHGVSGALPRRCLTFFTVSDWAAIMDLAAGHGDAIVTLIERAGAALPEGHATSTLHVRMFGGLEVRVGDRTIAKQEWRKRRARLILAMLVLEQGNELARDKISEYLWPEVDVEKATNNFYVAWSAMKNAILPGADKMTKLPYFESAHGLCRAVMTDIDADVAEFSELIVSVRRAQQSADVNALLQACQRLAEIYRGELLPGDLYDDWFAAARDRYRREFGDAMRSGAIALLQAGLPEECITLLRKGVEEDPWREDLYQLLLRAHMASGQRGAAIDVYLSCRHRLSEDLGLDPSAETLRLYEEILAMEEAETGYGSDTAEESSCSSEDG